MILTAEVIRDLERRFGRPVEGAFAFEFHAAEFDVLKWSQRGWRAHDITLFIRKGDAFAAIRKPGYPPGIFRAPSGGVEPGETVDDGALREAREETGLEIRLGRYVFRARARFTRGPESVDWVSHVFAADWVSGEIAPVDTGEIVEAFWVSRDEMAASLLRLRAAGTGGLAYRAALAEAVLPLL